MASWDHVEAVALAQVGVEVDPGAEDGGELGRHVVGRPASSVAPKSEWVIVPERISTIMVWVAAGFTQREAGVVAFEDDLGVRVADRQREAEQTAFAVATPPR